MRFWIIAALVLASPAVGYAESISYSNPYNYVWNFIDYTRPGDTVGTTVVGQSNSSRTGNLTMASDFGYATAYAHSETLHIRTSSSADGSQLAANGFDSIASEGLAEFDTNFIVRSDRSPVVDLSYVISRDLISTDPAPPGPGVYTGPHTYAGLDYFTLLVFNDRQGVIYPFASSDNVASYVLESGSTYVLQVVINAICAVKESTGYARATTGIDLALSIEPIPEPSTALLVIAGLLGLVGWRRVA